MRTHNLALIVAIFLVVGGLLSGFWLFQKTGFVEERAVSEAGSALVQTAQGANLDASAVVTLGSAAAFSSPNGILGSGGSGASISYPLGIIKDPGIPPSHK